MFQHKFFERALFLGLTTLVALFAYMAPSMAADATGACEQTAAAQSLGDMFNAAVANALPFGTLFSWVAYAIGAVMVVQGIYHFRMHSESPQNHRLMTPIMLWVGAGCLLALPAVVSTLLTTMNELYGGAGSTSSLCGSQAGTVSAGDGALDGMLTGFITNIKAPLLSFVSVVAIVCGLFMIVRGLTKAGKYGLDPKTHSIHSILTNIIFGSLLMTIGTNMDVMMASVFGTQSISTSSVINWSSFEGMATTQFQTAVESALTFVQLIGAIAFVRGWLVMKKVVEGGGNVTMAQGITHILGGVLAINIYGFLDIMNTTFSLNFMNSG